MNRIMLSGMVLNSPSYSHEIKGRQFYKFTLSSARANGISDDLPCIIPDLLLGEVNKGKRIMINGEIRTRNIYIKEKQRKKCELNVFVQRLSAYDFCDKNKAIITGYICKIGSAGFFIIASNRKNRADYIPTFVIHKKMWEIAAFEVGEKVKIEGRLQSRKKEGSYKLAAYKICRLAN